MEPPNGVQLEVGISVASISLHLSIGESWHLQDLYGVARRLIMEIRRGLEELEGAEARGSSKPRLSVQRYARQAARASEDIAPDRESVAYPRGSGEQQQKDLWKRKVEQVVEDATNPSFPGEVQVERDQKTSGGEDRVELMQRVTSDDEFRLLVNQYDAEAGAKMSLQRSGGMVDDLLAHGASVLGALGEQKERLKGAQHKMLDLLNSIGVSASLLRVIDRRQRMDAMLVYGGMVFTVLLLLFVWMFFGGRKK